MQREAYTTLWPNGIVLQQQQTELFGKLQLLFSQHEQTSMMKTIEDDSAKMQILTIRMYTIYLPPPTT